MLRRRRHLRITRNDQRLRHDDADAAALSGLRNREALQRWMVAHRIGRVTMRDAPHQFALVEIDRGDDAIGWLDQRKPLRSGSEESGPAAAGGCGFGAAPSASAFRRRTRSSGASAALRRIRGATESGALRYAELAPLHAGHVPDIGLELRRWLDQRTGRHLRIVRFGVKDVQLRIETTARPVGAAAGV